MAEMTIVKCDIGSKAATVLCPKCARISRQILKAAYNNGVSNALLTAHTCPVCGSVYSACNSYNAEIWAAAYRGYVISPDAYNESIKDGYNKRMATVNTPKKQPVPVAPQPVQNKAEEAKEVTRDLFQSVDDNNTKVEQALTAEQESMVASLEEDASVILKEWTDMNREDKTGVNTGNTDIVVHNTSTDASQGTEQHRSRDLLERKIARWKKELLDTTKRNKMINYRETKRQTLKILEPSDTELFNMLAVSEKTLTFQRPINKDSDFRTYSMLALLETLSYSLPVHVGDIGAEGTVLEREKTLKNLRAKTRLAQEEQGTNILYLSFGFILWRESNKESSPWMKSPLLMMPVELGLKALNAPYTLSKSDDEIEVNPTLDYLFNQDYGIDLPTFELRNKDSYESYLAQVEEIIDKRGWRLVREVSLGLLSFLKISMYHDLNENLDQMVKNPVVRAISGDPEALGELPAEAFDFNFDKTQPAEWHEVVNSDSSQEEAILLSKMGTSFVMQGPPGTGKSQTITNIIAEALGDGKKVLFVSEKAAALQVVLKRLTDARLDDFCLSLHNYKANKKEIIDNIGANLNLVQRFMESPDLSELSQLFHDRQFLDEYADELHKVIEPFGESVYAVFGKLAKLEGASAVDFKIEKPGAVSKEQFMTLVYVVEAFEKALHAIGRRLSENVWAGTAAVTSGQAFKTEMLSKLEGFPEALSGLETETVSFNSEFGTSIEPAWDHILEETGKIEDIISLPLFPVSWRDTKTRSMLRDRALKEEKIDNNEQGHASKLIELVKAVKNDWNVEALDFVRASFNRIFTDGSSWTGEGKAEYMSACNEKTIGLLESIQDDAGKISGSYVKAKELLKITQKDTPSAVIMVTKILQLLLDAPEMAAEWYDIRKSTEYQDRIKEAKGHQDTAIEKKNRLLESWEAGIMDIDADGMLARFKTDYTGVFHKLKSSYKEDIKQLKLLSKKVGLQLSEEEAVALLQEIIGINGEKKWYADNESMLKPVAYTHYKGIDTDWDKVSAGVSKANDLANQFPYANIPAEVIGAIEEIGKSIQHVAEVRQLADILKEELVTGFFGKIKDIGIITDMNVDTSMSEEIMPAITKRTDVENRYKKILAILDAARTSGHTTFQDVRALVDNTGEIEQEISWFVNNIPDIASELDITACGGNEKINKEISQAELILKNHDALAEKDETAELTALFGNRYTGNFTDWQGVIRDIDAVGRFEEKGVLKSLDGFIKLVSEDTAAREKVRVKLQEIKNKANAAEDRFEFFDWLFPECSMKKMRLHDVAAKYKTCTDNFDDLNKWLDYVETKVDCDKHGLASFTDAIAGKDNTISDVKNAFEKGFYMQWLGVAVAKVPAVQAFKRRVHEQRLGKFIENDERQFEISKDRIRTRVISGFPNKNAVTGAKSELRTLIHEMEKKRKIMPLRKLFHEIPNLLLKLKPCLMMSPLSVAYFLNADDYHFDMVIFDEASQIFPQDAIGAIFRADQTIIAGDTRQLPPTNFFASSTSNGNDDYDDDSEEDYEDEVYDSILEETANVLPNRTLLWHYRSRHEHLIAFSNQEIYKNELVTFPSSNESEPDTGVEFVFVEDGYYEGGGKNCNIPEAKKCVEIVKEHIDKYPDRSLGIIAFSEKQQQAISMEIQRFREQNPRYEEFFAEDKEESFFVKNLENVQGDERDTILFSIAYARTKEQKATGKPMAMRFGPLGIAGGERRLNVAITRAKTNVKLVSSIVPSDIDLSRTESEGIRMLRSYIEFAMNGGASLASANKSRVPDEFADTIYKYICDKGYRAKQYVGCSEYRIDIAVMHPEIEGEFVAGIECDGISYASARTARDRDRLRGSVLKNMGWNLYRVWSTEWYRNPEIECRKLFDFIEKAIGTTNLRLASAEKEKEEEEKRRQEEAEKERLAKEREARRRLMDELQIAEAKSRLAAVEAAKRAKEAEIRRLEEEKKKKQKQLAKVTTPKTRKTDVQWEQETVQDQYKWVVPGAKVQHDQHGIGTVKALAGKYVTVEFSSGDKLFVLPDSFEKGLLKRATEGATRSTRTVSAPARGFAGRKMDFYDELIAAGFNCIDNRGQSSIVWVIYDIKLKEKFEDIATRHNLRYTLERRGAMATGNKAAWRIMA